MSEETISFTFRGNTYYCRMGYSCLTMARAVLPSKGGYSFGEQSDFVAACEEAKTAYREAHGVVPEPGPLPGTAPDRFPGGTVEPTPTTPAEPPEPPTWTPPTTPTETPTEPPSSPPKQCLIAFLVATLGFGARLLPFLRLFRDRFVPGWVTKGYYRFSARLLSRTL